MKQDDEGRTQLDYLLNAFEQASRAKYPASVSYADKRRALFAYVRELERKIERFEDLIAEQSV